MHEQDLAIVRGLVAAAWSDGTFAQAEHEMLEGLLEGFHATPEEREALRTYAKERRTLDDIDPQELSADDRRSLLSHAALLSYVDGAATSDERAFYEALAAKLRVPEGEAAAIAKAADERAKRLAQ